MRALEEVLENFAEGDRQKKQNNKAPEDFVPRRR